MIFEPYDYETVAASQTDQVLGPTGNKGDVLARLIIVPASTSPGAVDIQDGDLTAVNVFPGGASSLTELRPIVVELNVRSQDTDAGGGGWSVTTGADVSVIAIGRFT